jgi:hypothetical protein
MSAGWTIDLAEMRKRHMVAQRELHRTRDERVHLAGELAAMRSTSAELRRELNHTLAERDALGCEVVRLRASRSWRQYLRFAIAQKRLVAAVYALVLAALAIWAVSEARGYYQNRPVAPEPQLNPILQTVISSESSSTMTSAAVRPGVDLFDDGDVQPYKGLFNGIQMTLFGSHPFRTTNPTRVPEYLRNPHFQPPPIVPEYLRNPPRYFPPPPNIRIPPINIPREPMFQPAFDPRQFRPTIPESPTQSQPWQQPGYLDLPRRNGVEG